MLSGRRELVAEGDSSERLVDQQRILADFGIFALTSDDLDDVLRKACELVVAGLGETIAKVVEVRDGGEKLYLRTNVGFEVSEENRWLKPGRGSSAGHALMSGTSTISMDAPNDSRFERAIVIAELDIKSLANVLIPDVLDGEGKWYGVLEVDSPKGNAFSDDEIDFLHIYANLVAAAVGRHRARKRMQVLLDEKEQLLRELQHRIKNNLAVVTGMVRLQSRQAEHPETVRQLDKIAQRVETLGLVHQELYTQQSTERIRLRPYLEALVKNLMAFNEAGTRGITIETSIDDHIIETDIAIPIGLIINEFLTNSLKYAFDRSGGRIMLALSVTEGAIRLVLRDDGRGLPEPFEATDGTGMTIIRGLANQLGGEPAWSSDGGAGLQVTFPFG